MIPENHMFSQVELDLLHAAKGKTQRTIDAAIVARDDFAWNTVRLHFDGLNLDVNNRLREIEVDELGTLEEFGLLSISQSPNERLALAEVSVETTVISVDSTVEEIEVVVDNAEVFGDGKQVASLSYPQAVILHCADGVIVLDKEVWFSEMIAVKRGETDEGLVYDDGVNWEDDPEDPSTHYEFVQQRVAL